MKLMSRFNPFFLHALLYTVSKKFNLKTTKSQKGVLAGIGFNKNKTVESFKLTKAQLTAFRRWDGN